MAKQAAAEKDKREQALERALAQLEKQYYKGVVMRMGAQVKLDVPTISTGSLSLDLALGVGGIPRGRVIEIFGPESSGKTTLALHIVANAQKQGGVVAFIDAEHAVDPEYAKKLGVDLDNLLINQPDTGEQALDITETLVRSNAVDVIVIDSVAALTPKAEIEGEMGTAQMGLQARLMSQAMRKLSGIIAKSNTCLIFINQKKDEERPDVKALVFSRWRAVSVAGGVGLLGGLVGQGGSFILIPLMTSFVKIPTRIALGSNLAIVLLSSAAAFLGKAVTGQIEWLLAVPIIVTVIPAAYLGGHFSQKVPVLVLRRGLAIVIALAAIRIWFSLLY